MIREFREYHKYKKTELPTVKAGAEAMIIFVLFAFLCVCFSIGHAKAAAASKRNPCMLPESVKVGAYVMSIHDINFHDREYAIRFWVWMRYRCPDFRFERRVEIPNAKTVEKQDTIIEQQADSSFLITLKLKCVMKEDWDVDDFPFDRESVSVFIENTKYPVDSLIFVPDESRELADST